ncbi:MAG TPA: Uma2 family endonuclease [Pseudonocardiaceae bacterium]
MAMPIGASALALHAKAWTLDEVLALPEDEGYRAELIDGAVHVSPAPGLAHQRVLQRLQLALIDAAPPQFEVLPGINVVLNGCRLLIPDLAVINAPGLDAVCCTADELVLAVEVISPSSRVYDNAAKRQLYAEADVPFLMVVDPDTDPVSAIAYELRGDEYREMARSRRGVLRLDLPFAARVDFTRSGR